MSGDPVAGPPRSRGAIPDATRVSPAPGRTSNARMWAVGDRILLKAGVNAAFREGQSVRMVVRDTAALPDATVEVVSGRVERTEGGRLQAVAEWEVKGRPRRRQQELKLQFYAEGMGVRSTTGQVAVRPARMVQIEVGAGGEECGAVSLRADVRLYDVARGQLAHNPEIPQGRRVEFEIPANYRGELAIEQRGVRLVRVDLSRVPGQDTIRLKLAAAGRQFGSPERAAPYWNRPAAPQRQPEPVLTSSARAATPGFPSGPSLGGPTGGQDAPFLYVCEVPRPETFHDLLDGRLYTTDRASDATIKKVHDTVIGVTTEVLDPETLRTLKVHAVKFKLAEVDGRRFLIVDANRAIRKRFARIDANLRTKVHAGGSEFAQGLTRGASDGAHGIVRRSFLALKGRGSWLGVLLIGSGEALYNLSQGAPLERVLDVFGMTVFKGALSMVLGTAAVGVGLAAVGLAFGAVTLSTGALVVTAVIAGYVVGKGLDRIMPQSQLSELVDDIRNGSERWLDGFDDDLVAFRRWFGAAVHGEPAGRAP